MSAGAEALGLALLRAATVALLIAAWAPVVRQGLLAVRGRLRRQLAWGLLLAPLLTPAILPGYGYGHFALSLIHNPILNDLFYLLLLALKLTPIAVVAVHFAPAPALSRQAYFCDGLLGGGRAKGQGPGAKGGEDACAMASWKDLPRRVFSLRRIPGFADSATGVNSLSSRPQSAIGAWLGKLLPGAAVAHLAHCVAWWLRGPGRSRAAAACVVFLLAFQDFELASLLGVNTWTVRLFDLQAGGLPLAQSLRQVVWPLLVQLFVLIALLAALLRGRGSGTERQAQGRHPGWARQTAVTLYLLAAVALVLALPAGIVAQETARGLGALLQSFAVGREFVAGILFALGAAALALLGAQFLVSAAGAPDRRHGSLLLLVLACLPGLAGALVLGLTMLGLVHVPPLRWLVGQEPPLLIALTLYLMPAAVLLTLLVAQRRRSTSSYLADLGLNSPAPPARHAAGKLVWELRHQPRLWIALVLFSLAFFDLTLASLLQPIQAGMTTIVTRLYNLMHYGRSDILSAMVFLAMLVPLVVLGMAVVVSRLAILTRVNLLWSRRA